MRNPILPLILIALAALAAGLWFASRDAARPPAASAPATAAPASGEPAVAPLELLDEPREPVKPALEPEAASFARVAASTEYEQELAGGLWVEGRVVIPPETPLDERAQVVANGKDFAHGPAHRADVAADGSFRAAFAESTKSGRLELEARYLYLDEPLKVKPAAGKPVVLEPRLGGVLSGRVLPPPDAPQGAQELVGQLVQLHGWMRDGSRTGLNINRWQKLDASLAFTFAALPADVPYTVRCDARVYEPAFIQESFVSAGGETVVDLAVQVGVNVAGRVVDESGAPVAGATVVTQDLGRPGAFILQRTAQTDAAGAFALEGIPAGPLTLEAYLPGYDRLKLELGSLERGTVQSGIELRLSRGSSISGRVLMPDGSPAKGAIITVEAEEHDQGVIVFGGPVIKTDASGAFTVTGLDPGAKSVGARYTIKEQVVEKSELLGRERERTVSRTLRTTLKDVEAGTSDLLLQLSDGETVRGSVVDDLGAPVASFSVDAYSVRREGDRTSSTRLFGRSVKDASGAFELTGFQPGLHSLRFEAKGYSEAPRVEFEVPLPADLPPIRLMRTARIAGVVLTPQGEPAPRAQIQADERDDGTTHFYWNAVAGLREGQVSTDQEGSFETDEVQPGKLELRALAEGFAPSEPVPLELTPGSSLAGITLRLRQGVKLTGLVLDADGKGAPWRELWITRTRPESYDTHVRTDESGAFEQDGLLAGTYRVMAFPTEAELAAQGLSSFRGGTDALSVQADVEVTEQGGHVVLTTSAVQPVRIHGTITAGGEPASASLWFWQSGGDHSPSTETRDDGSYEVLAAPGEYRLALRLHEGGEAGPELQLTVEGPGEQRLDFDVPVGAVEGRVLGPEGPLAGIPVYLFKPLESSNDWMRARAISDEHGRYSVDKLPVGTWTVQTGGVVMYDEGYLAAARYTLGQVAGVVVESGQRVRDVDLRVGAAGVVNGRVLTAQGQPAEGALVFARNSGGGLVQANSLARTDHLGNFNVGGLGPGSYSLSVLHGPNAAAEAKVELQAGEMNTLELRLEPATLLRVQVRDKTGAPSSATPCCVRSDHADFTSVRDWFRAVPSGEQAIGPVPPGDYTLWAEADGAASEAKLVTLKGEPEMLVELVL